MKRNRPLGIATLYTVVMLIALMGFVSFAVDFGRVQSAKAGLVNAADAAARFALTGITDSTATSKAQAAIAENMVDGSSASGAKATITVGNWSGGEFSSKKTPVNAVQVTLTKSVPLVFASVAGVNSFNVTTSSIAALGGTGTASAGGSSTPTSPYGWVGLGSFNISGNVTVDGYVGGTYSAKTATTTTTASNGWYNINGNSTINGTAEFGSNGGVSMNGKASITGSKSKVARSFSNDYVTASSAAVEKANNNSKITGSKPSGGNLNNNSGETTHLPAGTYWIPNFNINGTLNLQVSGDENVTIYARDNINLNGQITVNGSTSGMKASQLTIIMVGSGGVNVNPKGNIYADIYAPNSPLNVSGNTEIFGRGVFSSVSLSGNVGLHHDRSLAGSSFYKGPADPEASGQSTGTGTGIVLVK